MYYFYVLYSAKLDKYYYGSSDNTDKRLIKHLENHRGFTGLAKDWKLVYTEAYASRKEAVNRENAVKRKKSRKYIEWLISQRCYVNCR